MDDLSIKQDNIVSLICIHHISRCWLPQKHDYDNVDSTNVIHCIAKTFNMDDLSLKQDNIVSLVCITHIFRRWLSQKHD